MDGYFGFKFGGGIYVIAKFLAYIQVVLFKTKIPGWFPAQTAAKTSVRESLVDKQNVR